MDDGRWMMDDGIPGLTGGEWNCKLITFHLSLFTFRWFVVSCLGVIFEFVLNVCIKNPSCFVHFH
jgi:hypothetical protein